MTVYRLLFVAFSLLVPSALRAQSVQHLNPAGLPVTKSYTQVVTTHGGRTVYISGQVSANSKGEIVHKGDFPAQVQQVYENLKIALAAVGATFKDVVKTTTYVVNSDASSISTVRAVRSQYYSGANPPASTYIGVQALYDPDALIEIEVIAVVK